MSNVGKDLLWLLSGGVDDTIRHRNELKAQLAATQAELQKSRERVEMLEEKLKGSVSDCALPFIMLVALPKSASSYLAESLHLGLNIPWEVISLGYFPLDVLDDRKLIKYSAGQTIAKAHIGANPINLLLLKKFCPRMVLLLRDPRQALLSLVHYMKHELDKGDAHSRVWIAPAPTPDLLHGSLSEAIDWHVAHQLPNLLEWMEHWLAHAESGKSPAVLVTQYQDLRENIQTVVERILDFYQIPILAYTPKHVPKDSSTHFRKGDVEEWREVFNPSQQKICADLMAAYPRVNRLYGEKIRPNLELAAPLTRNGQQAHATRTESLT